MNKTLDNILSKFAKPVAKIALPLVMLTAGYQGAVAQTQYKTVGEQRRALDPPKLTGAITVVVEGEQSETLNVSEKRNLGPYGLYEKDTRHLDIVNVYHPSSGDHYSLIYPGDLSWNKGDTLKLEIAVHKDRDSSGKRLRAWTDYELVDYLDESLIMSTTPERKRYHTGVITDIKGIIPGPRE